LLVQLRQQWNATIHVQPAPGSVPSTNSPRLPVLDVLQHLQVPTVDSPVFWDLMDKMVSVNNQMCAIDNGTSSTPKLLQPLAKLALMERLGSLIMRVLFMTPIEAGSYDFENPAELVY
jgi:hypothetical protein